jgi:hypothetical protein
LRRRQTNTIAGRRANGKRCLWKGEWPGEGRLICRVVAAFTQLKTAGQLDLYASIRQACEAAGVQQYRGGWVPPPPTFGGTSTMLPGEHTFKANVNGQPARKQPPDRLLPLAGIGPDLLPLLTPDQPLRLLIGRLVRCGSLSQPSRTWRCCQK